MADGHDVSIICLVCQCFGRKMYDAESYLEVDVLEDECNLKRLKHYQLDGCTRGVHVLRSPNLLFI